MLPKMSGIDVCRELRTRSRVPIIMVTARNAEIDAVVGLEVGADDYVTKPFRLRELIARVRAALRRVPITDEGRTTPSSSRSATCASTRLATKSRCAATTVALPLKEFELLELLMANAGRVLTRDVLIDRIWGPNYFGDTKTLDVHIKRLRSQDRARPREPGPHRDGARCRLPLRARHGRDRVRWPASTSRSAMRCLIAVLGVVAFVAGIVVLVTVGFNLFGIGALAVGVIDLAWTVPELWRRSRPGRLSDGAR